MRLPSRRTFLKTIAGSAASLAGLGGYAFAVEPGFRLRVQRYALTPPAWPHDFSLTIAARELMEAGVLTLENEAVRLVHDGRPFWLLGLGDQIALLRRPRLVGVDDLPGTVAKITDDAPAILLAHEPDIFPKVPARIALTLSGHTHGGQVRVIGYSPVVPSRYRNLYAYGHVREGGRDLVVSGG